MPKPVLFLTFVTFVAAGLLTSEAWAGQVKSSTRLHAVKGEHYKEATITMRKAGGDPQSSGKPFVGATRKAR
jgi:hypothetical protein